MKTCIVIHGKNEVIFRGSWFGCLEVFKQNPPPLRIAVMRSGEACGFVRAELTVEGLNYPDNLTEVSAKAFY